jgi:S1-C subfamily serine protease
MISPHSVFRSVALLATLMLLTACDLPFVQTAPSGPIDAKRLFAVSKPGTVLVLADFKAHLTVPDAKINEPQLNLLQQKATDLVLAGNLANDQNAIFAWLIGQILSDPLTYFLPADTLRSTDVELIGQGSGFVISPDGYIVTNAHVAAPDEAELKQQLSQFGLKTFIDQDVQDFVKSYNATVSPDLLAQITQAVTRYDNKYLNVAKLDKAFAIEVGAAVPGVITGAKDITADLAAAGTPIPGKDIAILKVERKDLPTVPLGDDSGVTAGDKVYVIGYPAAATFHPLLSQQSQVEPTLTSGTVSARKLESGGWSAIQMDAPITHGSSGGPVFDVNGKVIGIATFGAVDPNTGAELQGFNFAVPISVAKEFIGKAGAKAQQGIVSQKYDDAITLYDKQWYSDALKEFQEVNSLSPGHPYVQEYITNSQAAVSAGKDRSNDKYIPYGIVGGVVVVLIAFGVLFLIVLGRRRRTRLAVAGGYMPQPPPAMPPMQPPQQPQQTWTPPSRPTQPPAYPPPLPMQPMPADQGSRPPSWPAPPTAPPPVPPPGYQAPTLPVQPAAYQPPPEQQPPVTPPPQVVIGFQPPARERGQETVVRNFCPNCGNSLAGKAVCDNCGYKG